MPGAIGGEHRSGCQAHRIAAQVREAATAFLDEDGERRDVEDVDVRLDDDVERAARQQVVCTKSAVTADTVDAAMSRTEARPRARPQAY